MCLRRLRRASTVLSLSLSLSLSVPRSLSYSLALPRAAVGRLRLTRPLSQVASLSLPSMVASKSLHNTRMHTTSSTEHDPAYRDMIPSIISTTSTVANTDDDETLRANEFLYGNSPTLISQMGLVSSIIDSLKQAGKYYATPIQVKAYEVINSGVCPCCNSASE
jgi:hypothetical protein